MDVSTTPVATSGAPDASAAAAIRIRDLCYSYGDRLALDGLSLAVPAGSIFGLLGPNGSGKSTLLSLLIGRRDAASGAISVLGEPLSARLRARIAIVFQEPSLDPNMTVRETMQLQGRMFGHAARGACAPDGGRCSNAWGSLTAPGALTSTLSGGMKRRLELARALLTGPELILLDEPTLALDPDSRLRLWEHLLEANRRAARCCSPRTTCARRSATASASRSSMRDGWSAEGEPAALKRDLRRDAVRIEWKQEPAANASEMRAWPGVGQVRATGRTTHVTVDEASPFLARLFQNAGDRIHSVQIEESTLEDVYFQLVGRGIGPRESGGEDDSA